MPSLRLDKFLANMQEGSRSLVKEYCKKGLVKVNDLVIKDPSVKIDTDKDIVTVEGRAVGYQSFEYYMLNKPGGVISATSDNNCKTVVELITDSKRKDIFPVGRLDKDTEGLLLITNDGELAHNLLSPKKHIDKTYEANIKGKLPSDAITLFENGLKIDNEFTALPAKLEILEEKSSIFDSDYESRIKVTIHEGKYHQVKRMFKAIGCEVTYLKRISMGSLILDDKLKLGEYRKLTENEILYLKNN